MTEYDETGAHAPQESLDAAEAAQARIEQLEAELLGLRESVLRDRAEIENQRKRMVRELEQSRRFANEKLLGDLLPVLDALERGLGVANADVAALREGMELTARQLHKVAADHGLVAVAPAAGDAFDPERHQAMSMVPTPEHPAGTVVTTFQTGWILSERLLRPALVVVAAEPGA